ncbi:hypothetical protein [Intestinirhabdus alba]|jgi:hypothetical protein|uniref:Uncharacterized protein n=1 Tax=Intestinirhabdus alba TaxID=2899544 RepID=A0A6L6IRH9_9ENTR|nr:hypothetical protein [Intestinirhabdus alba]MTH48547.1 hypothetical protein [Intestinirhabdus alba]
MINNFLWFFVYFVTASAFSHIKVVDSGLLSRAEQKILESVSREHKPYALDYIKYNYEGEDKENGPGSYYVYKSNILKEAGLYAIPYVYSTAYKDHSLGRFQKCNVLLMREGAGFALIENKQSDAYSPCLGVKDMHLLNLDNVIWFIFTVSYMEAQNANDFDYEIDEYYFFNKKNEDFCYIDIAPDFLKSDLSEGGLIMELKKYRPANTDISCVKLN